MSRQTVVAFGAGVLLAIILMGGVTENEEYGEWWWIAILVFISIVVWANCIPDDNYGAAIFFGIVLGTVFTAWAFGKEMALFAVSVSIVVGVVKLIRSRLKRKA